MTATAKPLVIYHDNCADGFGAAFAAWLKFGDAAEYLPMNYGTDISKDEHVFQFEGRDLYILDFSFSKDIMDLLFSYASRVVWLDHHKTAFETWCGKYEKGMFYMAVEEDDPRIKIYLDDNKSGALLAWEYFHPGEEIPNLIRHIDDRDRWQFKLAGTKEVAAALFSYRPWSFEQWEAEFYDEDKWIAGAMLGDLMIEGSAILRAQDAAIRGMMTRARSCTIRLGTVLLEGLACNSQVHISELGNELATKSGTYGLVWFLDTDNSVKLSFRSNGDYDVSNIAKVFGGGGHRNAAGATVTLVTLLKWLDY